MLRERDGEEADGLKWMLDVLPGTRVAENVGRVLDCYRDFKGELEAFRLGTEIGCPEGCGSCCEVTDPDVTQAEAEFLAVYLIYTGRPPLGLAEPFHGGCIFYDPASPLHCTVYEARPFLCRSFAFSSVRDKTGEAIFRSCRHMPAPFPRLLNRIGMEEHFRTPPPSMTDFGARISALSAESEERIPLSQALPKALSRIWLLKRLSEDDRGPDDTNPGDLPDGDGNDRPPELSPRGNKRAA
ncbi:MAG TPA: YkgJ family cysteine cluster protein [Spirochaetia bacterium]|nr:YkgJ family cysteine cluster protein [Spirochaetia bacterium]